MITEDRISYRKNELVQKTGLSLQTINRLIAKGELRSFRVGKAVCVSADALREFIGTQETQST